MVTHLIGHYKFQGKKLNFVAWLDKVRGMISIPLMILLISATSEAKSLLKTKL